MFKTRILTLNYLGCSERVHGHAATNKRRYTSARMPGKRIGLSLPSPISERLDDLVTLASKRANGRIAKNLSPR